MINLYDNQNFFLPGEALGEIEEVKKKYCLTDLKLGPGLMLKNKNIYSTLCGFLTSNKSTTIWLVNSSRIYVPKLNDFVIGKIVKVRNDEYKVDLGNSIFARLSVVAFANATKKVRPELKVGDSVYAKVSQANPSVDYELTCCDNSTSSSSFGPLSSFNSYLISIAIPLAHRLLMKNSQLVKTLVSDLPTNCDIVVGMNGFVYVSAHNVETAISVIEIFTKLDTKR